jgi:hypothetical protein
MRSFLPTMERTPFIWLGNDKDACKPGLLFGRPSAGLDDGLWLPWSTRPILTRITHGVS